MEIGNSFLIQHFMNSVWLINPEKLYTMTEIVVKKVIDDYDGSLNLLQVEKKEKKSYYIQIVDDIAVLNIEGMLVPKASWLDAMCGFSSTLELHSEFKNLVNNDKVKRIVLYFDSPGGVSTGIYEFAQSIYAARDKKEIVAFTDVDMCSAAYWLASAAEKIVVTPSSEIGSIGTYISIIKEKPNKDYDIHIFSAGENKLFGSPNTSLTEEESNYFKEKVNKNYEEFTLAVAKFRNVSQEDVKNTKASYYTSKDAPEWMYDILADADYILS